MEASPAAITRLFDAIRVAQTGNRGRAVPSEWFRYLSDGGGKPRHLAEVVLDVQERLLGHEHVISSRVSWTVLDHWIGCTAYPASQEFTATVLGRAGGTPISSRTVRLYRRTAATAVASAFPPDSADVDMKPFRLPVPSASESLDTLLLASRTRLRPLRDAWRRAGLDDHEVLVLAALQAARVRLSRAGGPIHVLAEWVRRNDSVLRPHVPGRLSVLVQGARTTSTRGTRGTRAEDTARGDAAFAIAVERIARDPMWNEADLIDLCRGSPALSGVLLVGGLNRAHHFAELPTTSLEWIGRLLDGDRSIEAFQGAATELDATSTTLCGTAARVVLGALEEADDHAPYAGERSLLRAATAATRQARTSDVYLAASTIIRRHGINLESVESINDVILGAQRRGDWAIVESVYAGFPGLLAQWDGDPRQKAERLEQAELAMAGTATIRAELSLQRWNEPPIDVDQDAVAQCERALLHSEAALKLCDRLAVQYRDWSTSDGASTPRWRLMPRVMAARGHALAAICHVWREHPRPSDRWTQHIRHCDVLLRDVLDDPRLTQRIRWEALNVQVLLALSTSDEAALVAVELLAESGGDQREVAGRVLTWLAGAAMSADRWRQRSAPAYRLCQRAASTVTLLPGVADEPRLPDLTRWQPGHVGGCAR